MNALPCPPHAVDSGGGKGCLLRALRVYALFVLASVAVAVSLGYLAAAHALRRAESARAEQAEPMEGFVARYPTQPASPAGLALDALTRIEASLPRVFT